MGVYTEDQKTFLKKKNSSYGGKRVKKGGFD